jgi:hypothetical protein
LTSRNISKPEPLEHQNVEEEDEKNRDDEGKHEEYELICRIVLFEFFQELTNLIFFKHSTLVSVLEILLRVIE